MVLLINVSSVTLYSTVFRFNAVINLRLASHCLLSDTDLFYDKSQVVSDSGVVESLHTVVGKGNHTTCFFVTPENVLASAR